jgi:cytochrome c biogenesis protein CcmG/thiol:disulfide interchange protein DsbE
MHRHRLAALVVASVLAVGVALAGCGGDDGAPTARPMTLVDGSVLRFESLKGTPVVVNFFASWCAPCLRELPDLVTVAGEREATVRFVGVNVQDSGDTGVELARRSGVTYPIARDPDGELLRAFGGTQMPTTVLLRADGTVADVHLGAIDAAGLRRKLDALG